MATNKIQTGIRFTAEMMVKTKYIAKKNRRSLTAQVEFLVQNCIDEYEAENGVINVSDDDKNKLVEY